MQQTEDGGYDVNMNDPAQVGELLQHMAGRINALQAACEVLTMMQVVSFKAMEDLYGVTFDGAGPGAQAMIGLFDQAIEKIGPVHPLPHLRELCGWPPVNLHIVPKGEPLAAG